MAKCSLCGAKIKPYFEICINCSNQMEANIGAFHEHSVRAHFMEEMEINV